MIALIQKLWNIPWDQWEYCNVLLHKEQETEDLRALAFVKEKIKREMQPGLGNTLLWKHF